MMKFSVAHLVLLHVCLSFSLSMNLNKELIMGLEKLNAKCCSAPLPAMRVPSHRMQKNAKHCLGVFIRELRNIVSNVTVREEHGSIVRGILANLNHMGTHEENDQNCPMSALRRNKKPFLQFINFVKELNSQL